MKRYAIKVRIQSDYLYEIDAETKEEAEQQAVKRAHYEADSGNAYEETYAASMLLESENMSMFDKAVGSILADDIHSQV